MHNLTMKKKPHWQVCRQQKL